MAAPLVALVMQCDGIEDIGLGLRWDVATLEHEVGRRAAALSSIGIGHGSVVAIAHTGSARFFADLFATWSVGATAACLDMGLTPGELQITTRFAKAAVLLVDGEAAIGDVEIPVTDLRGAPIARAPLVAAPDPDDPALVLFTSGTTGTPKGVVLSFRALRARIAANISAIGRSTLARTLVTLPTHFGHGLIGNALTPLVAGGRIILHPVGLPLAQRMADLIDEHRISFMSSVPALWRMALRYNPPSGNSLLRVHIGSAPLSTGLWSEVAAWSRAEVVNCYGMTETANWVAGASSRTAGIGDGCIGIPWGTTVAIKDDSGNLRASGDGEIVVRSPAMMSGYLHRPDLTAEAVRDGWFHTGDRGSVDARGRIRLTGRIKDEINRAGFKIQPAEIDLLLERHPDVAEACVFSIADPMSGEAVGAAVCPAAGAEISPQKLRTWCLEKLRAAAIPEHWFIVDELPRNARGKVSRDTVRQMLVSSIAQHGGPENAKPLDAEVRPEPDRELPTKADLLLRVRNAVEQAWAEVLDDQSLAMDSPWDEALGDSLDSLRLLLGIEHALGAQLTFDILQPGATPSMLAAAIEQHLVLSSAGEDSPAPDGSPLVFFFPPLEGDMPHIARFRSSFNARFRFSVIHYPNWSEMIDAAGAFGAIANTAIAQIRAQQGTGPHLFFGCSSGGFVAWETARGLLQSGDRIGFLGLIDARRSPYPPRSLGSPLGRATAMLRWMVRHPRGALLSVRPWLIQALVAKSPLASLRRLMPLASLLPAKATLDTHMRVTHLLRRHALRDAAFGPLGIAATLFRSDLLRLDERDMPWSGPHDYGWSALCKHLTIVNIEGSHSAVWEAPYCDFLRERLVEALDASLPRAAGTNEPRRPQSFEDRSDTRPIGIRARSAA